MLALKKILVATDFSEPSDAALLYGRNFARAYGAALHVLHVVDDVAGRLPMSPDAMPNLGRVQMELEAGARRKIEDLLTDNDRRALRARTVLLTSSRPAEMILSYARDEQIDLIIVGTHGRTGIAHFFMGSVAQHVVRLAPCPVLTVRHPEREFTQPDALCAVAKR